MQKKYNIIVTGANGFLGRELFLFLTEHNCVVYSFARKNTNNDSNYVFYDINKPLSDEALSIIKKSDIIIHCAHQFTTNISQDVSNDINFFATKEIAEIALANNIKLIYISSASATSKSLSYYSKLKFKIEKLFNNGNYLIIKPSLIIGKGGIAMKIDNFIKKSVFIPLIKSKNDKLYYVFANELSEIIWDCILNDLKGSITVSNPIPINMEKLYRYFASLHNKRIIIFKVPYSFVYFIFSIFELFKIKLPINKDSLIGIRNFSFIEININTNLFKREYVNIN
ncbi:MAG: hypothetical protein A2X12_09530 [Bacteroidetes bacterium GWE2_29_8]|nr:MAG: hypothetical protein A2X12_09530 [Bacteroidetes bacterium GWE2_29_8]OFY17750.1 MAG: hypothetical protein A2X02_03690 [Bacteroidetes bacterium GWF2_29_10]